MAHPRRTQAPSADEQALLERHRPRFFLPPGHAGLISFYDDYIAQGTLTDGAGHSISEQVTADLLNAHKADPRAVFTHRRTRPASAPAVVFGRIDQARVELDAKPSCLTFLTYHAVFRQSGLPAALRGWQAFLLGLIGDLDDWHQLDHYTAATLVLDDARKPIALMLQHHNYIRTYPFGRALSLPADGRPLVDVAIRSNELYPHAPGRTVRRAARFGSADELRYMIGFAAQPMVGADDLTEGVDETSYALRFLPPDDAFYSFAGFLGERRRLPGRDAPPGADYNTLPSMKPLAIGLLAGFWRDDDRDDLARLEASYARTGDARDFARLQAPEFAAAVAGSRTASKPAQSATERCSETL